MELYLFTVSSLMLPCGLALSSWESVPINMIQQIIAEQL